MNRKLTMYLLIWAVTAGISAMDTSLFLSENDSKLLVAAAKHTSLRAIKKCLEEGAHIDARNQWGDTPLHCAARAGNSEVVRYLLLQGADRTLANHAGHIAFQVALNQEIRDIFADITPQGERIIIDLAEDSEDEVAQEKADEGFFALLEHTRDSTKTSLDFSGVQVEHVMAMKQAGDELQDDDQEAVVAEEVLDVESYEEGSVGEKRKRSFSLERAVKRRKKEFSEDEDSGDDFILETSPRKREPQPKQTKLNQQFLDAVRHGRTQIVEKLLDDGADIAAKTRQGNTCLHIAASYNTKKLIALLLSHGADVTALNNKGETPFHTVHPNIASLLEENLEKRLAESNGARDRDLTITALSLRRRGVPSHLRSLTSVPSGPAPLPSATSLLPMPQAAIETAPQGPQLSSPQLNPAPRPSQQSSVGLPMPIVAPRVAVDQEIIRPSGPTVYLQAQDFAFIDVRMRFNNQTVLHRFIDQDVALIRSFLERGADINARDGNRNTPLILAAMRNNMEMMTLLLQYGADIHLKNKDSKKFTDYLSGDVRGLILALIRQ